MDYEYKRKGVCHQLLMCEPLRGWRHVKVTERRTRRDYAECVCEPVDVYYPRATKFRLAQDNLNTHDGASLCEVFPPAEARRILNKIEWHHAPKHGSWVNMAETEISIMEQPVPGPPPGQRHPDRTGGGGLGGRAECPGDADPLEFHSGCRSTETP
jgi:hypothetical protein